MIIRTTEQRITDLTRKLELLVVQQNKINVRVNNTRNRVARLTTTLQQKNRSLQEEIATVITTERVQERTEAVAGSGYYIGDQVDMQNPNKGQDSSGVVIGRTKYQLIKIQTESGKVLRRLPKNIRLS